jgi:nucleotide-binding universal stress UspA family protein
MKLLKGVILVGTDFSDLARAALDWAVDLADPLGARIVVAHVFDLPIVGFPDAALMVDAHTAARLSDDAQKALDAEIARVRDRGVGRGVAIDGTLKQGDPRDILPVLATSLDAGLIVIASHGRRGLAHALLGSVAESVIRGSKVPVTVVRQAA